MPPLASLLRPQSLDDYIGQSHLVGKDKPIFNMIEKKQAFSLIFWGPPGVGKTTLARIIAKETDREFFELSAVSAKKDDIKTIIDHVKHIRETEPLISAMFTPVVFLDEIHRFNKAQQDFLLPYVEDGTIILIGATTENPSFEVIAPLLSRCRVFVLKALTDQEIDEVIDRAVKLVNQSNDVETSRSNIGTSLPPDEQSILDHHPEPDAQPSSVSGTDVETVSITADAKEWLTRLANGDARSALTLIDQCLQLYGNLELDSLKNTLQSTHLRYDKKGEEHYDTISAFIKSMRASNPDAALYYLARMVDAGEDPKFIARRMIIFASEDIGLAQPTALVVANGIFEAVTKIGYPEAQINLAHGVAYLSQCKKDRSAYDAYFAALDDVKKHGNLPIPMNLRNAPTKLMKEEGYGKGYEMYSKDSLLPEKLKGQKYLK